MSAPVKVRFYSAWFCPYAQRAWMVLNNLGISHTLIESLEVDEASHAYKKNTRLLEINPKGLVPTLEVFESGLSDKGKNVDINGTYGDLDSYKLKYNLGHCNVVSYDVCSSPPLSYHSTSTGVAKNEVELFSAETIHNAFAPVNIHQFLDDTDSPGLFLRNLVIFDKTMVFRTNISNIRLTHQQHNIAEI